MFVALDKVKQRVKSVYMISYMVKSGSKKFAANKFIVFSRFDQASQNT